MAKKKNESTGPQIETVSVAGSDSVPHPATDIVSDANLSDAVASSPSSYQVVARRYRPQGFGELIGQDHIAKALIGAIQTGRVGHAYLFTGARGVGKTSSARILAKALNCVHGPTPTPCNECEICRAISAGDDIDVLEIDGASNRGIDEIRQLRQSATIRPSRARFKIYIIDEVHMLTREAFNALLKTLEEPPEHVKFIFCTTEPTKLPITILSRCQRFDFAGINAGTIADHLKFIAGNEGVMVEEGVCETLARRANGSMRDAQSLLEQLLSFAPDRIALSDVHAMLGTVDDQKIYDLLSAIQNETPGALFPILNKSADEGVDFGVLLEQMTGTFRDLLVLACGCGEETLLYSGSGRLEEMKQTAATLGPARILASMQILSQTITRMRYSTQGRILAEMTLVRLCALGQLQEAARLIEQLKSGTLPAVAIPGASVPVRSTTSENFSVASSSGRASLSAGSSAPAPSVQKKTDNLTSADLSGTPFSGSAVDDAVISAPDDAVSSSTNGSASAPGIEKVHFAEISQERLVQIWRQVTGSLGLALSASARTCSRLAFSGSVLRIGFAPVQKQALTYCQKESAQILKALSACSDDPVRLDFYLTDEAPPPEKPKAASFSTAARFEQMRKKIGHPMIKEAEKLFGAELAEVRDEKPSEFS